MKGHKEKKPTNRKLPKGHYAWAIIVETGKSVGGARSRRKFSFVGTQSDADAEVAKRVHQVETGAIANQEKWTVGEYLNHWLEVSAKPNTAPRTYEGYAGIVRLHLIPGLGSHRLTKLTPLHIQKYYQDALSTGRRPRKAAEQKKAADPKEKDGGAEGEGEPDTTPEPTGLSAMTVKHHHRVFRQALQQAVRWRIIRYNPADAVQPPRAYGKEMNVLDESQVVALLSSLEGHRLYMPVLLAVNTGMRRGEILGLRWSDVDLKSGDLFVNRALQDIPVAPSPDGKPRKGKTRELVFRQPKTTKSRRRIALPASTTEALRVYRKGQVQRRLAAGAVYEDGDLVICREDGRPWHPGSFSTEWQQKAKSLGLEIRFHDLRHTHATLLLRSGEHPKVVSDRLGHSSVSITLDTYSHVLPDQQEGAAERLDQMMAAARLKAE